jgi:hypothetical protein
MPPFVSRRLHPSHHAPRGRAKSLSLVTGAADISLAPSVVERLDALINERTVGGDRYNKATQQEIDTENF